MFARFLSAAGVRPDDTPAPGGLELREAKNGFGTGGVYYLPVSERLASTDLVGHTSAGGDV